MNYDEITLEEDNTQFVLLVEDDPNDLALLSKKIKKEKETFQIDTARTIYQAYEAMRDKKYDYVFLDLNLPDGFGIETIKEAKPFARNAKIIVTTGLASELTRSEAIKAGAHRVFMKSEIHKITLDEALDIE